MLDRLVLADRPAEDDALLGIARRARQRRPSDADRLRRDQDALRVHAVQDAGEALALIADAVLDGNGHGIEEHLVGIDRHAAHLVDLAHLDVRAVERGIEEREALGALLDLLQRRGARQQQHALRHLRGRGPDLLAVHDVTVIAFAHGAGLDPGGVEARIGLGDGEAGLLLAGDQRRQEAALLLLAAEHHDRVQPEDVHMHGGGAGERSPRLRDRLHHDGGLRDAEPGAAVSLGDGDAEPTGLGERAMEFVGKFLLAILARPVVVAETGADLEHAFADLSLRGGERQVHAFAPANCACQTLRGRTPNAKEVLPTAPGRRCIAINGTVATQDGSARSLRCGRRAQADNRVAPLVPRVP